MNCLIHVRTTILFVYKLFVMLKIVSEILVSGQMMEIQEVYMQKSSLS